LIQLGGQGAELRVPETLRLVSHPIERGRRAVFVVLLMRRPRLFVRRGASARVASRRCPKLSRCRTARVAKLLTLLEAGSGIEPLWAALQGVSKPSG
jgi:hypothetical protein